ncbi:hypothetical protein DV736_g4995, partial [Chaetothyriales sp. CBS 134916]
MSSSFFTLPASQRKRKRPGGPSSRPRKRVGLDANGSGGDRSHLPERGTAKQRRRREREREQARDEPTRSDSDASSADGEGAAERRVRLAQKYLDNIRDEIDETGFDAADLDNDLIAQRLRQDADEASGRQFRLIAQKLDWANAAACAFRADTLSTTGVAVCPPYAYTVSKDKTIIKWELQAPARPKQPSPFPGKRRPKQLAFVKGVVTAVDKTASHGHVGPILAVAASADGQYIATGGADNRLIIWSAASLQPLKTFYTHRDSVLSLAFAQSTTSQSGYGAQLFSASADRSIKTYNLASADSLAYVETLFGHQDHVCSVVSMGVDQCLSAGSRDRSARLWKVVDETQLKFLGDSAAKERYHAGSLDCVAALPPSHFVTGDDAGAIRLWSIHKKKPLYTIEASHGADRPPALEDVSSESDPSLIEALKQADRRRQQARAVTALAVVPGTDVVVSGSWDGWVRCWSVSEDKRSIVPLGVVGTAANEHAINGDNNAPRATDEDQNPGPIKGVITSLAVFERRKQVKGAFGEKKEGQSTGLCIVAATAKELRLGRFTPPMPYKARNGAVTKSPETAKARSIRGRKPRHVPSPAKALNAESRLSNQSTTKKISHRRERSVTSPEHVTSLPADSPIVVRRFDVVPHTEAIMEIPLEAKFFEQLVVVAERELRENQEYMVQRILNQERTACKHASGPTLKRQSDSPFAALKVPTTGKRTCELIVRDAPVGGASSKSASSRSISTVISEVVTEVKSLPRYKNIGRLGQMPLARNVTIGKYTHYFPEDEMLPAPVREARYQELRDRYKAFEDYYSGIQAQRNCVERCAMWRPFVGDLMKQVHLDDTEIVSFFKAGQSLEHYPLGIGDSALATCLGAQTSACVKCGLDSESRWEFEELWERTKSQSQIGYLSLPVVGLLCAAFLKITGLLLWHVIYEDDSMRDNLMTLSLRRYKPAMGLGWRGSPPGWKDERGKPANGIPFCLVCGLAHCPSHGHFLEDEESDESDESDKKMVLLDDPEDSLNIHAMVNQPVVRSSGQQKHVCGVYCVENAAEDGIDLRGLRENGEVTGKFRLEMEESRSPFGPQEMCSEKCFWNAPQRSYGFRWIPRTKVNLWPDQLLAFEKCLEMCLGNERGPCIMHGFVPGVLCVELFYLMLQEMRAVKHQNPVRPEPDLVLDQANKYKEDIRKHRCMNNRIQLGLPARTIKAPSEVQGFGLFAGEDIPRNGFIGEYKGEVTSREECNRRGSAYHLSGMEYLFNLNQDQEVDASNFGNKTRFMNNSSNEQNINVVGCTMLCNGVQRVMLCARRDIRAGEELLFDYKYPEHVRENFWERGEGDANKNAMALAPGGEASSDSEFDPVAQPATRWPRSEDDEPDESQVSGGDSIAETKNLVAMAMTFVAQPSLILGVIAARTNKHERADVTATQYASRRMHRTYSMRQSRAPTASQLENPPPPTSSTKSGRLFGRSHLGHAFRKGTAGAFGPDLAKKLSQLVKMEKNVMRSMELVGRERMEQQLSLWGEGCDDDVSDVTDKLGVLIYEIGELEDQFVDRYDQYRVTIKSIRNIEASVQPSRDRKQKITDQIAQLKYKEPNSPRIVVLEQELVRAEAESLVAEAQLSNITREKLKAAFTYQFDALREHCEKMAIIAGYGKHLLELVDDTPVTPGETRAAYDGYEASKAIIQDCEDALTNWVQGNAAVKSSLSTRSRTLSQRRKNAVKRNAEGGVDLSAQDQPLKGDRDSWVPAGEHGSWT